jgi:asparagine synthase (glutamine-hydrolysing)
MCGIAGFVQRTPPPPGVIERMTGCLAHRGPDGDGVWRGRCGDWHIALGHRRLAILDIAGGAQPMGTADGASQITYNGEIFNHLALRRDLEARGHAFRTRSDTEVILHHLHEHGASRDRGLPALDGMFAFAHWDARRGELLLTRDRCGIKPLYHASLPDGGLAFASELTSLLQHPAIPQDLDPDAVASYFFMDYAHAPSSFLRAVRKLEPASFLTWNCATEPATAQVSASTRYWSPPLSPTNPSRDRRALASQIRDSLNTSVAEQLIADVPVGVFLSGGLDSSMVAALARRNHTGPLKTFTIRLADPDFDQSSYARTVAEHLGTEHIEQPLTEEILLDSLDVALDALDEPLADPSLIPTHALSAVAARHVKVVLGGDGADELWAGYPTCKAHRLARLYALIPRAVRAALVEPLIHALPVRHGYQSLEWKARRFVHRWDDRSAARHLRWMSTLDLPDLAEALANSPSMSAFPEPFRAAAASASTCDAIADILRLDFETYMPGAVLTKVDRASMSCGLEVRPPMLANRMVDLAFGIPSSLKMRGNRTKALLKDAAAPLLPRDIIHRRKMGFAIPLARWLRGPLNDRLHAALDSGPLWSTGLLRSAPFQAWAAEHESLRADRSRPLWALLVFDHWLRRIHSQPDRPQRSAAGSAAAVV